MAAPPSTPTGGRSSACGSAPAFRCEYLFAVAVACLDEMEIGTHLDSSSQPTSASEDEPAAVQTQTLATSTMVDITPVHISSARDQLTNLPTELSTMILSYLPIEEIIRAKAVNRSIRNVVTSSTLGVNLFQDHAKSALKRLRNTTLPLLHADGKPHTFTQALTVFVYHRGIQIDVKIRSHDILAFARLWAATRGTPSELTNAERWEDLIVSFAHILIDLHVTGHVDNTVKRDYQWYPKQPRDDLTVWGEDVGSWFLKFISAETMAQQFAATDDLPRLFESVRSRGLADEETGTMPLLRSDSRPRSEHLPHWPLTKLNFRLSPGTNGGMRAIPVSTRVNQDGVCSMAQLRKMLGEELPALPETNDFAYCVTSREAWLAVRNFVGRLVKGEQMGWRMRALVLERMYIH